MNIEDKSMIYRGWSEEYGWVFGYIVQINTLEGEAYAIKDTLYHVNDGQCDIIPTVVEQKTIGRCLGLKDANDVWIFEGDICDDGTTFEYSTKSCAWQRVTAEGALRWLSTCLIDGGKRLPFKIIGDVHKKG